MIAQPLKAMATATSSNETMSLTEAMHRSYACAFQYARRVQEGPPLCGRRGCAGQQKTIGHG